MQRSGINTIKHHTYPLRRVTGHRYLQDSKDTLEKKYVQEAPQSQTTGKKTTGKHNKSHTADQLTSLRRRNPEYRQSQDSKNTVKVKEEMPHKSQNTDQPLAPRGRCIKARIYHKKGPNTKLHIQWELQQTQQQQKHCIRTDSGQASKGWGTPWITPFLEEQSSLN